MSDPDSRRSAPLAAALLLLAVVAAAALGVLLTVDASAAGFETTASGSTTAASSTAGNASPPVPTEVTLVVRAPDPVRPRLEGALREAFAAEGLDVTVAAEVPDDGDGPVAVVAIDSWDARWNPVTPRATVEWRTAFDVGGHERHVEAALADETIVFDSRDGPDAVVAGDYRLDDSATGLVSRPAYRRHLAEAVARETVDRTLAAVRSETV